MKAMYGKKLGMTRIFLENGESIPVTVLEMRDNVVYQVKSKAVDGYQAIQVGIGEQKQQRLNRPQTGHFAKAKKGAPKLVGEIRLDRKGQREYGQAGKEYVLGEAIAVDSTFTVGSRVDVVGTTIGKGFAGVMKRHGMKGSQTWSHGTHEYFRHGGSIGCRKFPGRVFKNKRMGGHMGAVRALQEGLEVVAVRAKDQALLVRGSVPGPTNGLAFVRQSVK